MTEVAHIDATPHCPSVIRQLLGKAAINFREVTDDESLPLDRKVQAILVDDSVGALFILFPQNHLLDLNRITELTGRKLKAVPKESLELMLQKHKLGTLPGLPSLTSSPCLYEERILSGTTVLIDSGEPGLLLEISRPERSRQE